MRGMRRYSFVSSTPYVRTTYGLSRSCAPRCLSSSFQHARASGVPATQLSIYLGECLHMRGSHEASGFQAIDACQSSSNDFFFPTEMSWYW